MFNDCHIHIMGAETCGSDVLKEMDRVGMEKAVLMSPPTHETNEQALDSIDVVTRVCAEDTTRLQGFAWIEPTLSGAVEQVEVAINDKGLKGIKMIPNHWYPYEERLFPVYRKVEELRKPILFHSGILYANGDSSRFCRPCFFEAMLHFPKMKFALAHIGWPWTDECVATFGRMCAAADYDRSKLQMYIDITRGTPRYYRREALDKALRFAGPDRLLYGSDSVLPGDLNKTAERVVIDRDIIVDDLGYSNEEYEGIAGSNMEDFLRPLD